MRHAIFYLIYISSLGFLSENKISTKTLEPKQNQEGTISYLADSSQDAGIASFEITGAWEGSKEGTATIQIHEDSRRFFVSIDINDINSKDPKYRLKMRVESWEALELPKPGTYPIVSRGNPDSGYEVGFETTYTQILEYGGGPYYANVALEYKAPSSWEGTPKGQIVIESVSETHVEGSFEFELWENASINKAPLSYKGVSITKGKFNAQIITAN